MQGGWLDTLEARLRAQLAAPLLDYVLQGAREGVTAGEAAEAWQQVRFLPRVLRDVTHVDLSCDLLGRRSEIPWGVAPSTLQRAVHPEGELAVAHATREAGGVMVVSSNAGATFADIGATGVRWWLQAYLPRDRSLAAGLLERATAAGAEAVVLTVDTPVVGTKYATGEQVVWDLVEPGWLRVNFDAGYDDSAPGAAKATDLSVADLAHVRAVTGLPVVVKGVLRPDDATACVEAGAAAIWVSNHGGRQLDRSVATARALPGVATAVSGRAQVYVDGGLRSGLDVLAALALGADAAFVGRLPLFALVDGRPGVARLHQVLADELTEAMRLAGAPTVADTRGLALLNQRTGS